MQTQVKFWGNSQLIRISNFKRYFGESRYSFGSNTPMRNESCGYETNLHNQPIHIIAAPMLHIYIHSSDGFLEYLGIELLSKHFI